MVQYGPIAHSPESPRGVEPLRPQDVPTHDEVPSGQHVLLAGAVADAT